MRRDHDAIVVTGAGLVTALGATREATWRAVQTGACGIGPLTALEQSVDPPARGGEAPTLPESAHAGAPVNIVRNGNLPREVSYLRTAINEAVLDATIDDWPASDRCAVVLGTTLAGMRSGGAFLRSGDPRDLQTFLAGAAMQAALDGLPCTGPAISSCAACASGLASIAIGVTMLQRGEVDLVIAGGYDPISEYVYAGFNSLRLIAPDAPQPFSVNRTGMNLGEGYGIVLLERAATASARHARIRARILGIGESTDAFHLTQPHPDGAGASQAILAALRDAALTPDDIDLISAHATATPHNDAAEYAAYQRVFGESLSDIPVTAFKSHLGHTLGGAGAVELVLTMLAMRDGIVPPVAGVSRDAVEFANLNLVTDQPRRASVRHAIGLSLGFGGTNSCIAIGCDDAQTGMSQSPAVNPSGVSSVSTVETAGHVEPIDHVCITGIGLIAPGCIGRDAWRDRLLQPVGNGARRPLADTGEINEADILPLFANARRVRRFSTFVKQMLAACTLALDDAGVDDPSFTEHCTLILGSTHGSVAYTEDYYRQVVEEGIVAANPMLFAEGVPNVASAQLSMMLNARGGAQTIIGTRTAGLDALCLAAQRIAAGQADRIIVGASEEYSPIVNRSYQSCGLYAGDNADRAFEGEVGCTTGAGAAAIVLEREEAMQQRGGRPLARISASAMRRVQPDDRDALTRAVEQTTVAIGSPGAIMTSACGTWIDAVERDAIAAAGAGRHRDVTVSAMYGHLAECFSVTPLAAMCAVVGIRRLPPLLSNAALPRPLTPATAESSPESHIGVLCTDPIGLATAVGIILS